MLRFIFALIVLLHGAIHLMGFAKAYGFGVFPQLSKEISKPAGAMWLVSALMMLATGALFLLKKDWWWLGLAAALLSQYLIVMVWQDAKFGTLANLILLVAALLAYTGWRFENRYRQDVQKNLTRTQAIQPKVVTESDLAHLPAPVQAYLRYVGVVGKPRVQHFRVEFEGEMREKGKDWFPFRSEQYDFFDQPTRLFFMKGVLYGLTVPGYHAYKNGTASMEIKPFGIIPIVDIHGDILNRAETVTLFNDLCLMAPAALIQPNITWEAIDSTSAKAHYTVGDITIAATLYFNEAGQLINFISDDRYAVSGSGMKQYRFSTPVHQYQNFDGFNLCSEGDAVWHYPDGAFTYGKFRMRTVEYNR